MTGWMRDLASRAGPLLASSHNFLRTHDPDNARDFPSGGPGLTHVSQLIEEWCEIEDPGDEPDRRFIEGCGAVLGLLLLDHLGGEGWVKQDEVHRVRVGEWGFFDPFGAVEAALDADDPKQELANQIRDAELEARGAGRVSRVVVSFVHALRSMRPDLAVVERFGASLWLTDGVQVDLSRVVDATATQSDGAVDEAILKVLGMLPGAEAAATTFEWDEAQSRLFPRLVSETFLADLEAAGAGRGRLWSEPVGNDVHLSLVLQYEDRARYVREDEVASWTDDVAVVGVAIANLARCSEAARFARVDTKSGPLVMARSGDGLDAARLLLPGLHGVLAKQLGSPVVVAVPHAARPLTPRLAQAETLRARARDDALRAPHPISDALFRLDAEGLEPI